MPGTPVEETGVVQVKVLLFASFKEQVGERSVCVHLPDAATVHDLLHALRERLPSLAARLNVAQVAVNEEYVAPATVLHHGDEVALIPPVSGGTHV